MKKSFLFFLFILSGPLVSFAQAAPSELLSLPSTNRITTNAHQILLSGTLPLEGSITVNLTSPQSGTGTNIRYIQQGQDRAYNIVVPLSKGSNNISLSIFGRPKYPLLEKNIYIKVTTWRENLLTTLKRIDDFMWGTFMMVLLLGTGIVLTFRLRGIQFRRLGQALRHTFSKKSLKGGANGDITPFQALTTTLAATVGNGNIAGVATAIAAGGPGALFWMWITALIGMATRATEAMLGVKYRRKAKDGSYIGGTFYYLEDGAAPIIGKIPAKILAVAFALAGMVATFGIGNMVQSNSVALSFNEMFNVSAASIPTSNMIIGIVLMLGTAAVLLFGVKGVGKVSARIVPFMGLLYVLTALFILILNITSIPQALALIVSSAFTGKAAIGGFIGITVARSVKMGVARGIFSNEAGLGTGSLAHSAAQTDDPAQQGSVAMVGTFIDTLVICTMTGLIITLMLIQKQNMPLDPESGKALSSTALTMFSFTHFLPGVGKYIVAISSILFGYSTLIGWSYYGEQCTEYIFGVKSNIPYRVLFIMAIYLGAVTELSLVWTMSDILNGFMAIPNLIGLLVLSGVAAKEYKDWISKTKRIKS